MVDSQVMLCNLFCCSAACTIEEAQTVTLTGGKDADKNILSSVTRYEEDGSSTPLANLNHGQAGHTCGHYTNSANSIVQSGVLRTDVDIHTISAGVYSVGLP